MTTPNFRRMLTLVKLASAVYQTDSSKFTAVGEALGLLFVALVGDDECQAMVVKEPGGQIIVTRGTQVTEHFSAHELWDDACPLHTNLGDGAVVRAGAYTPFKRVWDAQIAPLLDRGVRTTFTGHSLGAQRSCYGPLFLPLFTPVEVVAFAPPKAGNAAFWAQAYNGRLPPLIVGRRDDFAPAWCPADDLSVQYGRILHLVPQAPGSEWVSRWPWDDASISAHGVDDYAADVEALT